MKNIDIGMVIFENIDKSIPENIDIDLDKTNPPEKILRNIDIDIDIYNEILKILISISIRSI